MSNKTNTRVGIVGMIMGIAETIPGVSGGTIAFIFKIYEELLSTIKSFDLNTLSLLFKGRLSTFFEAINGKFLLFLLVGMAGGIVIGIFGIHYLLEHYPLQLWSFFFGLVIASAAYLSKDVEWNWQRIALFFIGALLSFMVTGISPVNGSENLLFVALCGTIAISALMLPGISGSFILLLLGMYSTVIGSLKNFISSPEIGDELKIIIAFAIGCMIGLVSFSRVLSYTFKNYFHSTMAAMIGILIGSLNKLWPWRVPRSIMNKETGVVSDWNLESFTDLSENYKVLSEVTLMPSGYSAFGDPYVFFCILSLVLGIIFIGLVSLKETK